VAGARGRILGVMNQAAAPREPLAEFAAALQAIPVSVIVSPGSGINVALDWWSLELRELNVVVCEYELKTAEQALVHAVAAETRERLDTGSLSPSEAALVIRLELASRMGVLADLLHCAQVVEIATV
jgi:hypothetical protein